jgi:hypothetical protein
MISLLQAIIDCLQTVSLFAFLSLPIGFALLGVLFLVWPRRLPSFAEWMRQRWRHPRLVALAEVCFGFWWAAVVYGLGAYVSRWIPAIVLGHEVRDFLFLSAWIPFLLIAPFDERYATR